MGGVPRGGCIFARHLVCVASAVACLLSSFFVLRSSGLATPKKRREPGYKSLFFNARCSKVASSLRLRFLPPNFMRTATTQKDNTLLFVAPVGCGRIRRVAQAFRAHDLCNDFTCARVCHAQRHMLFDLPGATRDRP